MCYSLNQQIFDSNCNIVLQTYYNVILYTQSIYYCLEDSTLIILMRKGLASRTALKFQRYQIEKTQQNMSAIFTTFRTHAISKSDAEIMLPQNQNFSSKNQDSIYLVTSGDISFYAQISQNSFADKSIKQISILQNLVSIAGITLDSSGTFKGEIKKQKIPETQKLQYAQILVKNMYLSRRDQYKVLKSLSDRVIHVYNRKTLYFDKLKLEVTNLMQNNQKMRKTGIITKDTKIIFRSGCSKYTILVQISKQMFELNEQKELYLEKTINFLLVFFQRNNFFNNKHRIEIILFARLFYPQFSTLKQTYQCLLKDQSSNVRRNVFTLNYAVAFQKDCKGRIYQDVYRRMLWPSGSIVGFRERFWQRVSQFMFTINWPGEKSYAKNISESVEQNIQKQKHLRKSGKLAFKVKPFLHRLPCQLSCSRESCFFQAISMIAQQYKHHYYFRSLSETGNAITVVSAGKSFYTVDETTYRMAKSNIYLTNINLIHVNLKRRQPKIQVQILQIENKPRYKTKEQIKKLQNLIDWCLQQDAYKSPTIMNIQFADDFELKSAIFPDDLQQIQNLQKAWPNFIHYCTKSPHFMNSQTNQMLLNVKTQKKQLQWISAYYISEKSFLVHNFFYDNANFQTQFVKNRNKVIKSEQTQFSTFERDLRIIINKKTNYGFSNLTTQSTIAKRVTSYVVATKRLVQNAKDKDINSLIKEQNILYQMKYMNKFFEISALENQDEKLNKYKQKKMMSNSNTPDKDGMLSNPFLYASTQLKKNQRKASDASENIQTQRVFENYHYRQAKKLTEVNIFEQTFKRRQYTSKIIQNPKIRNRKTHNRQRLKKNYPQSNIHYMLTYYNEASNNYFTQFIRRPEARTQDQKIIYENFELQKQWKNIIFPILTPIYTNYEADLKSEQMYSKYSEFGEAVVQEQICKYLMDNFQIEKQNLTSEITMSKGHVHLLLSITAKDNVTLFEAVNVQKQKQIVPKMLYRYLCYEQKDYRFGSKSLLFSDQNYYIKQDKKQEKKSVKLVMLEQFPKGDGSCFKDFIKLLKQRYKLIKFDVSYAQIPTQTYSVTINLVEDLKNRIYKSQKIDIIFDTHYNPDCLYQMIVEWHYCCATYVNQFIENTISSARKSKILTYLVSKANAFNTRWTTSTIGEIIFQSRLGMDMLQDNITSKREWLWDREGYYMDRNGEAFIRFNKQKYLIQWYDNTIDKTKWKRLEVQNRFYETFFMKSAAYDFLGGIIDSFTNNNSRKSSLALST